MRRIGLLLFVAALWAGAVDSSSAQTSVLAGFHGGVGKIDFSGYEGLAGGHLGVEIPVRSFRLRLSLEGDAFPFTKGIFSVRTGLNISTVFDFGITEPYVGLGFFGMYTEFEVPESLRPFADDTDYGVGNYALMGLGVRATDAVFPFLELLASGGKSKGPSARLGLRYKL